MYRNELTDRYNAYSQQPIQYMNNQMLASNPIFTSNIYDPSFHQKMLLQREEQMQKIKNISELGLTKEQITEYVITPLKIEKTESKELERLCDDNEKTLLDSYIKDNLWAHRTNAPYKTILKNQNIQREYKDSNDLIVHKFTSLDKVGLMDEYEDLLNVLEKHNGNLKVIFSTSKKNEHLKAFKFVEKHRKRIKYNPKDYNELKDFHKKESQKFDRDRRKLDMYIERINADDIDPKELKQLESELFAQPKKNKKSKSKTSSVDQELVDIIEELDENELLELESEVLKEIEDEKNNTHKNNDSLFDNNVKKTTTSINDSGSKVKVSRRSIKTIDDDTQKQNLAVIAKSNDSNTETQNKPSRITIKRVIRSDKVSHDKVDNDRESASKSGEIDSNDDNITKPQSRVKVTRRQIK